MPDEKLEFLRELYRKIEDGTATEKERNKFEIEFSTNCMSKEPLMKLIKGETR